MSLFKRSGSINFLTRLLLNFVKKTITSSSGEKLPRKYKKNDKWSNRQTDKQATDKCSGDNSQDLHFAGLKRGFSTKMN